MRMISVFCTCVCLCSTANLAQIAFESVVSIVNSLHNSQELIRDQQGRNSLLATYLYWVFRLPDPPRDIQNAGSHIMISKYEFDSIFFCLLSFLWLLNWRMNIFLVFSGSGSMIPTAESRYSTMGRATAATVGNMLLQSRVRSSSNPDIPAPHTTDEDAEVNNILSSKVRNVFSNHLSLSEQLPHLTKPRFAFKGNIYIYLYI